MASTGSTIGKIGGGILGGVGGFFLGGPGGVLTGASLGSQVGGGIGGFIDPEEELKQSVPTRNAIGLGGDAAFNQTANVFGQQLSRQLNQQTTDLNRQFNTAGRFNSGQRLEAVGRAQEFSREAFGDFLNKTALERFLAEQRNLTQLEAARIGADAGTPSRASQVGGILSNVGNIVAQSPEFFIDLLRGDGGSVSSGNANLTRSFANIKG